MGTGAECFVPAHLKCPCCCLKIVASVDAFQAFIKGGFHTELQADVHALAKLVEVIDLFFCYAVRSGSYNQAANAINGKGFFSKALKMVKAGVGVGKGLKVSQVFLCFVFFRKECNAFLQL